MDNLDTLLVASSDIARPWLQAGSKGPIPRTRRAESRLLVDGGIEPVKPAGLSHASVRGCQQLYRLLMLFLSAVAIGVVLLIGDFF
jgi:hypothetical protein